MMNRPYEMYSKGGLKDEGGEIDPVSGNEVPVGGTKKGVRDDIPANLSEGEFVMPEDATRYHGLKTMMQMRQEAKMGLKQMEAMGLMGNSEEAVLPDDIPFGLGDLVVVELDDSGLEKEVNMNVGGMASGQEGETISLSGSQQATPVRERVDVTFDEVMGDAKMEFKEYRNAEGQSLMVPFIGGVPMYPIPEGYTLYTGEGSEVGETPEVPTTGADELLGKDDDDDAVTTKAPESIDWQNLSNEEFVKIAEQRNGFGRNMAAAVGALINPIAGLATYGLMRYEDQKVLAMAQERLKALPANSPERAKYEQLVKNYEARESGFFGGVIDKLITSVGDMLGLDKAKIKQAKINNMIGHGKDNPVGANGIPTEKAIEAVQTGTIDDGSGGVITPEDYVELIVNSESKDPAVSIPAKERYINYIGAELGSFVDPNLMQNITEGAGGRTPEQTRVDIVNAVYQPVDTVRESLTALSPEQKNYLGVQEGVDPSVALQARNTLNDPNTSASAKAEARNVLEQPVDNYLDIVDSLREDVSQILPTDAERGAVKTRLVSENLAEGETQRRGEFGLTPESRAASVERREAGTAMGMLEGTETDRMTFNREPVPTAEETVMSQPVAAIPSTTEFLENQRDQSVQNLVNIGISRELAEATVPAASTKFVEPEQTGLEALEAPMPSVTTPSVSSRLDSKGETPTTATTTPVVSAEEQMEEIFTPIISESTGTGTGRDFADMPVTPQQQTYASASQSREDPYDPRNITRVASEQTTNIPVTTTAQTNTQTLQTPTGSDSPTSFKFTPDAVIPAAAPPTLSVPTAETSTIGNLTTRLDTKGQTPATTTTTPTTGTLSSRLDTKGQTPTTPTTLDEVVPETTAALGTVDKEPTATTTTGVSFNDAFASARASGASTFTYDGKSYTTETKEEKAAREEKENDTSNVGNYFADRDGDGVPNIVDFDDGVGYADTAKEKTTKTKKDRSDSSSKPSSGGSNKDNNVASSGRTETDIQKDINDALNKSGGEWTSELNDLVSERDSARKNEGSKKSSSKKSDDGGGGGGGGGSDDGDGGCCFIMLEARYGDGTMDEVVRRYRDEFMTDRNRRGYYKVAEVFVPLMRKSTVFKWLVTKTFADPLVSYGKYYYGQGKFGVIYSPVKTFWMKVFNVVGGDTKFIRENGEVV